MEDMMQSEPEHMMKAGNKNCLSPCCNEVEERRMIYIDKYLSDGAFQIANYIAPETEVFFLYDKDYEGMAIIGKGKVLGLYKLELNSRRIYSDQDPNKDIRINIRYEVEIKSATDSNGRNETRIYNPFQLFLNKEALVEKLLNSLEAQ